jgi:hypothetical protein
MYKLLIIFMLILSSTSANADYFRGIKCSQNVSEVDGLILDATKGANFEKKEYRIKNDFIQIGEVKSNLISYLFWNDRFLGIAIDIFKKDDYNKIIRHFNQKYGPVIRSDKNKSLIWLTDDAIIIVNRFSTHLAQAQVLCRELYNEMHGLDSK